MNAILKSTVAGAVLLVTAENKVQAQYSPSKYEVGLNIGTLIYQGDLSSARFGYTKNLKPAVGLWVSRAIDPYFSVRADLNFGKINADESKISSPEYRQYRNFKFSTPVTELTGMLVWNPFGSSSVSRLNWYLMGGAGISFLNVKRDWHNINTTYFDTKSPAMIGLGIDTITATPRLSPVFPVGAGLRYQLSDSWALHSEIIYRFTTTDYLDGFKYAANPNKKDSYYGVSVGISFKLGNDRYRCPKVN